MSKCLASQGLSTHHSVLGPEEQALTYFSHLLFPAVLLGIILTLELSLSRLHWRACFYSNWSTIRMSMGLSSDNRLRLIESKADGHASFPD